MKRRTGLDTAASIIRYIDEHFNLQPPHDDAQTYEMISRGETDGIFMMETEWDKYDLQQIRPQNLDELTAAIALSHDSQINPYIYPYIKRTRIHPFTKPEYIQVPAIEQILQCSRGMLLYKEQSDHIRQIISSLGEKEKKRYALGIRIITSEIEHREGSLANLSFAKERAVCCYKMAYLKAHLPKKFDTLCISSDWVETVK